MSTDRALQVGGSSAASSGVPVHAFMRWQLQFTGANGSTTIPDVGGRVWTAFGSAQISTTDPAFPGGGCLLLDGINSYIRSGDNDDSYFANEPFTFDFRFKRAAIGGSQQYILTNLSGSGSSYNGLHIYLSATGIGFNAYNGGGAVNVAANSIVDTAWHAYRVVSTGAKAFLFQGGMLVGSGVTQQVGNAGANVYIGVAQDAASGPVNGRIAEIRLLRGIALTRTDYTVDTAPFSAVFA